jgi:Na+/H+-translocating membrane pyrophosphatase
MTDPAPADPHPGQVPVQMLAPLGGHNIGDLAYVDADLVDTYVAAGYVERLNP